MSPQKSTDLIHCIVNLEVENLKYIYFYIRYWGRIRAEEYPLGIKNSWRGDDKKKKKTIERWMFLRWTIVLSNPRVYLSIKFDKENQSVERSKGHKLFTEALLKLLFLEHQTLHKNEFPIVTCHCMLSKKLFLWKFAFIPVTIKEIFIMAFKKDFQVVII